MITTKPKKNLSKNKTNKKHRAYYCMFFSFIAICLFATVFCFQYYNKVRITIREESKMYLQEITRRIGDNMDRIINDNFAALFTMASVLETLNISSISDIEPAVQKQQSYWNYEAVLLVDETGKAQSIGSDKKTFLIIDADTRKSILTNKKSFSTTQIINNQEYGIFSVPLTNVEMNGKKMVALAAIYDPLSFDKILSMTSFNEQAYSQIITTSGTIVTQSSSPYAMKTGYNIFTSIQKAQFDNGSSIEQIKKDIASNRSDQISFTLNDIHCYMVYTPIQLDEWCLLTFIPVQVVNQKSDMLLKSTLAICALIAFTFSGLIGTLLYVFNNYKRKLEHIAYVDEVTGGNTIQAFYEFAKDILSSSKPFEHALIYTNLEKFKVLNEQLGRQNCDNILHHFYKYISSQLSNQECIGRLSADNFCILLRYEDEKTTLSRFSSWYVGAEEFVQNGQMSWTLPITEFGIYVIENNLLPLSQMIDRAKLSLREFSRSFENKLHYAFYNDAVRRQLFREKYLEDIMEQALSKQQFRVYLQPKYHLPDETIGGAEALVRWENPQEGMIYPNEFIPLFEKNGFIVNLDLWVFEEVCRTIQLWCNKGLSPIKISVNCSRIHFKDPEFLISYTKLAKKYNIERKYIEIELTESVVLENVGSLTHIIDEIKQAGFGCSMDDFGSGYSSLNLIQSIPVDTLKLDKIFFHGNQAEAARTEAVIGSIITMARALSMETVAEGVEQRDQVEMLKRIGCDYIQGYVFAKPMEITAFENLAFNKVIS